MQIIDECLQKAAPTMICHLTVPVGMVPRFLSGVLYMSLSGLSDSLTVVVPF